MSIKAELLRKENLYKETQIDMAYNSLKLDGIGVSRQEVEECYEKRDVEAVVAHFNLFDYMLETSGDALSEELIKAYHAKLVSGGGEYRSEETIKSRLIGATEAGKIPSEMKRLMADFNDPKYSGRRCQLAEFHARFRNICPFEEMDGCVNRMLLFKECLRFDEVPILVTAGRKTSAYSLRLAEYNEFPRGLEKAFTKMRMEYRDKVRALAGDAEDSVKGI